MWDIPQIFDWQVYYTNRTSEKPPTEDQLRQMTYQWISGGANGIIYYDFTEMHAINWKNPFNKEWEKVKKVAADLKEKYVPIILSNIPVNPGYIIPPCDHEGGKNYYGRRMFNNGYDYILIVNVRTINNYKIFLLNLIPQLALK